jgi:anti-sigma regulatory factor (Ser/Thr protein kinase)
MLSTVTWSHQTHWPPAPHHVADARRFVVHCLHEEGLGALADPAALVVSELATNAVKHAQSWFEVRVARHEDHLVLEVHDESDTFPSMTDGRTLATGGRGLHLVDALSHDWGVQPQPLGGKCVWATFDLHLEATY